MIEQCLYSSTNFRQQCLYYTMDSYDIIRQCSYHSLHLRIIHRIHFTLIFSFAIFIAQRWNFSFCILYSHPSLYISTSTLWIFLCGQLQCFMAHILYFLFLTSFKLQYFYILYISLSINPQGVGSYYWLAVLFLLINVNFVCINHRVSIELLSRTSVSFILYSFWDLHNFCFRKLLGTVFLHIIADIRFLNFVRLKYFCSEAAKICLLTKLKRHYNEVNTNTIILSPSALGNLCPPSFINQYFCSDARCRLISKTKLMRIHNIIFDECKFTLSSNNANFSCAVAYGNTSAEIGCSFLLIFQTLWLLK